MNLVESPAPPGDFFIFIDRESALSSSHFL